MKKRILSAAIILAIVILLLIVGSWPFALGVGCVAILAFKEVIDLMEKEKKLPTLIKLLALISLLYIIFYNTSDLFKTFNASYQTFALLLLFLLTPSVFVKKGQYTTKDAFYLIGWIVLLGMFFNSLLVIVNNNLNLLIYLILITALNDTFALFFGMLIGKHKLLKDVSPKKTIEGSIGGLAIGSFVGIMFYINVINPTISLSRLIIGTIALSVVGQIGDLLFSKIKREHKVKDFSNLIPEHGGVLDRLDSLIFVLIAFLLLFQI